jgi:hypothetical protein
MFVLPVASGGAIRDYATGQLKMEARMHNSVSLRMILRLLGASAALALLPTRALSDTLDEGGFRPTVIALLSRRHPDWHVELGPDPQTIKIGTAEIYLDNIYRYVRDLPPAERDDKIVALIENGVARSQASPEKPEFTAASNRIRPHPLTDALFASNDTGVRLADAAAMRDHGR